jgi:hypothetical protein
MGYLHKIVQFRLRKREPTLRGEEARGWNNTWCGTRGFEQKVLTTRSRRLTGTGARGRAILTERMQEHFFLVNTSSAESVLK